MKGKTMRACVGCGKTETLHVHDQLLARIERLETWVNAHGNPPPPIKVPFVVGSTLEILNSQAVVVRPLGEGGYCFEVPVPTGRFRVVWAFESGNGQGVVLHHFRDKHGGLMDAHYLARADLLRQVAVRLDPRA
jgi:hypothetical protein